jgi:putative hydrolase of the HAD superfamily
VQPTEAVVFDLDSTLCVPTQDDEAIHDAIFERVSVDPFFEPADFHAVEFDALPEPDSETEHYRQMYEAAADVAGADPDDVVLRDLAEATLEVMDNDAVTFRPGAEEALAYAREHYAVGLLTAGSEATQREKLAALGIRDAFDATVYCGPADDVETKPHPEPFELVLDDLGVRAERAVYVGDRLHGDVTGAHNAGMQSVWVPLGDEPTDPEVSPSHRLDSLADLPEVV